MHTTTARIAGVVSGLALSAGLAVGIPLTASAASAPGDNAKPAPCAQEQRQVDKAESALARATANFAKQKKATGPDKAAKVMKAKKAKKAQVQRLAKAEARLAACTAPVAG